MEKTWIKLTKSTDPNETRTCTICVLLYIGETSWNVMRPFSNIPSSQHLVLIYWSPCQPSSYHIRHCIHLPHWKHQSKLNYQFIFTFSHSIIILFQLSKPDVVMIPLKTSVIFTDISDPPVQILDGISNTIGHLPQDFLYPLFVSQAVAYTISLLKVLVTGFMTIALLLWANVYHSHAQQNTAT